MTDNPIPIKPDELLPSTMELMVKIKDYWTTADGEPELRGFAEYVRKTMGDIITQNYLPKDQAAKDVVEAQTRYTGIGEYLAVVQLMMEVGYLLEHRRQGGMQPMTADVVKELWNKMKAIQDKNDKYMRPPKQSQKQEETE